MTITALQTGNARQRILDAAQPIMASRGYSAVGLNEVLLAAGVPKGSFYHYFGSKDVFGQVLLAAYFDTSLAALEEVLQQPEVSMGERLMRYWQRWADSQTSADAHEKCLVVKLGAEVSDLSAAMRQVLSRGTASIIERLATAIQDGMSEGSVLASSAPDEVAQTLYQTWLGASVMAKITCSREPFDNAASATRRMLQPESRGVHRQLGKAGVGEPGISPR